MLNTIRKVANLAPVNYVESSRKKKSRRFSSNFVLRFSNLQRPDRLITKLKSINFDENKGQKLIIVRQPRNADEKSKGFTHARVERAPGVLMKSQT